MPPLTESDFLERLEREAAYQGRLSRHQLLPAKLKGLGRFVVRYPWQFLLIISWLTTLLVKIIKFQ